MKMGFIGLGQMGAPMAAALVRGGHELVVYNRTPDKAAPVAALGASVAEKVKGACEPGVVFTMLTDDRAVEEVVFGEGGILSSLGSGVHVSCSTISVDLAERLAAAHAEAGQGFVSAPVFGRPVMAEGRKLIVVAGGSVEHIDRVRPALESIGQRTFVVADEPSVANLVKLSGNLLIGSMIESLGEAMALVGAAGIDRREFLELFTSTLFDCPIYHAYGGLVADRAFEPAAFAAPLGLKDVGLVLSAGERLRVPLPIANILRDRLLTLIATGGGHLDWSAIGALPAGDTKKG